MKTNRIHLSENKEAMLLTEVNWFCPLCHKSLIEEKNGKTYKRYELAHIYPHSPTKEQREVLANVPRPEDIESMDNLIPLCKECHGRQDYHTTVDDYMKLFVKKQDCAGRYQAKCAAAEDPLDIDIVSVVSALDEITDAQRVGLAYTPIRIREKVKENSLIRKIESNVAQYFHRVQEEFSKLEDRKANRFDLIASQVKSHFLRVEQNQLNQEAMFELMVDWLANKTRKPKSACEIVVSYFVQDCEVFHASAQ